MRKTKSALCVLLAAVLMLSAGQNALAATDSLSCGDGGTSFNILAPIEKSFQMISSVFARLINNMKGTDETDVEKASALEKSWQTADGNFVIEKPETTVKTETWVCTELTYTSDTEYDDSFNDVTLDLILIGNGRKYTVPGFWDGGSTWKVRFVCPSAGEWYFCTVCSDKSNTGLHNRTGKAVCTEYSGELDIYKNGFVTTAYGEKYLTYDNGEPFFYLGDTHWSLGEETEDMVNTICEKRQSQGFTVMQSEPIGATFNADDGITEADIEGLRSYDKKFEIIARYGFVHANAEFFFPSQMNTLINNFGGCTDKQIGNSGLYELSDGVKTYLEKLSRYWVARYGAYPVIWTLGQEVDDDFYRTDTEHPQWGTANNPYKLVAEYIDKYDCYDHPLTAHQENAAGVNAYGGGENAVDTKTVYNDGAKASVFRDVKAHTLYAAQWTPSKTGRLDTGITKDYWYNSQGKPVINYEGQYCYLWTKNFGARMQGWCSYLSGMYGYGWGAQDTWSYLNTFGEDEDSSDGVDTITAQEKQNATWQSALGYDSGYQCGYMAEFLKNIQWYNLVPRFDNKAYFVPGTKVYYVYASNADNSEIVIYFYSFNDSSVAEKSNSGKYGAKSTGTVGNLEKNTKYNYKWFNPITGEYTKEASFVSSYAGTWYAGSKAPTDMVLYIAKAE